MTSHVTWKELPSMSIRLRLGLWYGVVLMLLVLLFGLVTYSSVERYLRDELRQSTLRLAGHFVESLQSAAPGASLETLLQAFDAPDVAVAVYDAQGRPVARTRSTGDWPVWVPEAMPVSEGVAQRGADTPVLPASASAPMSLGAFPPHDGFVDGPQLAYRVTRRVAAPSGVSDAGPVLAVVVGEFSGRRALLDHLQRVLAVGGVAAALASVGLGWAVAGGALRPVSAMIETARAIARSREFGRQLPVERPHDELGRLATAFNEMLAALGQAFENQRRFVADASHELRAPLATIQGNLDLLERAADLPESERQAIWRDVRDEVRRLGRLVSDLLSLARGESGQPLKRRPVELDRLVTDVLRAMRVELARHRLTVDHLEPVQVSGDPDRLRELLVILLDNAVRYTPEGGRIRVWLGRSPQSADQVELAIEDTGIGIAPEDLPHIFERFYRADKARSRQTGGTGLGLAIARWIAEAHGGSIHAQSQVGLGSRFTVRLPA